MNTILSFITRFWKYSKPIGGQANPYLLRWHIIHTRLFNIYLHKTLRSDDPILHDHPWWFVSFMLSGSYLERTQRGIVYRSAPSVAYRTADHMHQLIIHDDKPCWTLVVTGPIIRPWGFLCSGGWKSHNDVVWDKEDPLIFRGCGE